MAVQQAVLSTSSKLILSSYMRTRASINGVRRGGERAGGIKDQRAAIRQC